MKKLTLLVLIVPFWQLCVNAQTESTAPKYGISFSGFVKNDFFFDTRDYYTIREGHFLLYPKEISPDATGTDINAVPSFNFLSIQSRLTGKITAPDAFGAKTSGVLEADFFGNENTNFTDNNGFRLRHAVVKLNWANTELLTGQYWHPFFIPGCFSGVISFNTGVPMQPFSRNPQIRLSHNIGKLNVMAAVAAQRDFTSPTGSVVLRYASIPDISAGISFETKNSEKGTGFLAGAVAGFKMLQPLRTTANGNLMYVTNEKVQGFSATAYMKTTLKPLTIKMQAVYGQNLFDLLMLGGFAVHEVTDPVRNLVNYTTINNLAVWAEFESNGEKFQTALWAGYTQNLGANQTIFNYSNSAVGTETTVRGANLHSVMRISPRLVFIQGKFNFATELEFTRAAYAARDNFGMLIRNEYGVITQTESVNNYRLLLSVIYKF